jgi:hypothetical protein
MNRINIATPVVIASKTIPKTAKKRHIVELVELKVCSQ